MGCNTESAAWFRKLKAVSWWQCEWLQLFDALWDVEFVLCSVLMRNPSLFLQVRLTRGRCFVLVWKDTGEIGEKSWCKFVVSAILRNCWHVGNSISGCKCVRKAGGRYLSYRSISAWKVLCDLAFTGIAFWIQEESVNDWVFFISPVPFLLPELFLKVSQHMYSGAMTRALLWLYHLVASHKPSNASLGLVCEQETSRHLQSIGVWGKEPRVASKGAKFWLTWPAKEPRRRYGGFFVVIEVKHHAKTLLWAQGSGHCLIWVLST